MVAILLAILDTARKGVHVLMKIEEKISAFADSANASLKAASSALDNISGDVSGLKSSVDELKAMLADVDLPAEAQAKLDEVSASATALATKAQGLADATPDSVPAPIPTP